MLPKSLLYNGVEFDLGSTDSANAVVAKGQTVDLPAGKFTKVWVLAAASDGDQKTEFRVGSKSVPVTVEDWGGFIGQWDTRAWKPAPANIRKDWAVSANHEPWDLSVKSSDDWSPKYPDDYLGMKPGFVKPANVAWYASHHHTAAGKNEPYEYSYLFAYAIDLPAGATTLTLPKNGKVKVLAVSVADEGPEVKPAQPLYDTLGATAPGKMLAAQP